MAGGSVSADSLAWQRIDDDVGDDGEGWFYGLEEVDNVGVQRDEGIVKFVDKNTTSQGEKASEDSNEQSKTKTQKQSKDQSTAHEKRKAKKDLNAKASSQKKHEAKSNKKRPDIVKGGSFDVLDEAVTSLGSWPSLNPELLAGLQRLGFTEPSPVQAQAIPPILEGRDIVGKAATGSGKTLAFGLPILERYLSLTEPPKAPTGLVIAPTRELAHQIRDHLCAVLYNSAVAVTGGLAIQKQLRLLEKNPAVVVATPGRLLEVLEGMSNSQRKDWQSIGTLVLDEADRLVQQQSFKELDACLDVLGRGGQRQTLVFSATFEPELWSQLGKKRQRQQNQDILGLLKQKLGLRASAGWVDADPTTRVASQIAQAMLECPAMEKDLYLYYFVVLYPGRTLVFVNSIDAVKRLVPLLKELSVECFGVHSDMVQKQRLRSIERFRNCTNGILIATDVAARGLDVPHVDHVVHYHLPRTGDAYVHRSGRTARAGADGVSLALCSPQEAAGPMRALSKLLGTRMSPLDVDFEILERLRNRVRLAKEIADSVQGRASKGKTASWEAKAAEELGFDLPDEEDEKKKQKPGKNVDVRALRAEIQVLLKQGLGPRRKYLTNGTQNLAELLLKEQGPIPGRKSETALEAVKRRKTSKSKA